MNAEPINIIEFPMPTANKRFVEPTIAEIVQYGESVGLPERECHKLFHFYSQKDWYVGKSKMKRWRSSVSLWALNYAERGGQSINSAVKPKSIWELKQQVEAKEKIKKSLFDRFCHESPTGNVWDNHKSHGEYLKLKLEIKQLNDEIANL